MVIPTTFFYMKKRISSNLKKIRIVYDIKIENRPTNLCNNRVVIGLNKFPVTAIHGTPCIVLLAFRVKC